MPDRALTPPLDLAALAREWLGLGWKQSKNLTVALFVFCAMGAMFIPLPAWAMDLLLVVSLALGITLLMTTMFIEKPLDFSAFPSILLIVTLYRLSMSIATTRLILSEGHRGKTAAGDLIAAFGSYVAGGGSNEMSGIAIGLTIFAIITLVQFLVITKGATRIAEVAARFSLDSLPGRQMAVDADLNAGLINEQQAKERREEIGKITDFYGAMDGASKFVRGDAIASIITTLVNIAVGFIVGMLIHGQTAADAAVTYTVLTIGDGLVTQIPALLISIGSGLLITRSSGKADFGEQVTAQLFGQAKTLLIGASVLGALGLSGLLGLSPFPAAPLLIVATGCGVAGWGMTKRGAAVKEEEKAKAEEKSRAETAGAKPAEEKIEDLLKVEPMQLEVGYRVIPLVDSPAGEGGGGLLARVGLIRNQLASEMGIIVPRIRIRDNIMLESNEYVIKIQGAPVARGTAEPDKYLAINTGAATGSIPGIETREPSFGMPAVWIEPSAREYAERQGYTVFDVETVVATHLTEVIKSRAADLLNIEETRRLLDATKAYAPNAVAEAEAAIEVGGIRRILQNLLRERVSIRNMPAILEAVAEVGRRVKDADLITEYARMALSRWICNDYSVNNKLAVVVLDPRLEDALSGRVERTDAGAYLVLRPAVAHRLVEAIAKEVQRQMQAGHPALVLTAPQIRRQIKQVTQGGMPQLAVLSQNEVAPDFLVESVGMVQCDLA